MLERRQLSARWCRGLLLASLAPWAQAVCNNPSNAFESPTQNVKVFLRKDFEVPGTGKRFEVPGVDGISDHHLYGDPREKAYPISLPRELWDQSGKDAVPKSERGDALFKAHYFEPAGRGEWRLCRIESWRLAQDDEDRLKAKRFWANQSRNHPLRDRVGAEHHAWAINTFVYDSKGRIEKNDFVPLIDAETPTSLGARCYRYNDRDEVTLVVDADFTKTCPKGEPDWRDRWERAEYMQHGDRRYFRRLERHYPNSGSAEGWSKVVWVAPHADRPNNVQFKVSELHGVEEVLGFGAMDNNNGHSHSGPGGLYTFPGVKVPLSVVDNPDAMYGYPRKRRFMLGSASFVKVSRYPANSHVSAHTYVLGAGRMMRHEQRDPVSGRLKRAINVGFEDFIGTKQALWEEDKIQKPLHLKPFPYVYRVWEYDEKGKGKLVAIGWNRNPLKKRVDEAPIVFGTPNGVRKWRTKEAFLAAFGSTGQAVGDPEPELSERD